MIININHPIFTTCNDIAEISKPLQQLGITYFDYMRNYHDGGRISLVNNPFPTKRYLSKKYYLSGNMDATPEKYKAQIVFLDTLPKQHIYDDVLRSHNIDHGMQIINPQGNYCEFFGFATVKGNGKIINTYLTRIDLLKKFCDYFLEKAAPLIKLVDKNKLILPHHNDKLDFLDKNDYEMDFEHTFSNKMSITKRQLQCAKLLLSGKNNRQISELLHLSARTVEHYLNNLKMKLKCKNKTELIIKLVKLVQ